jgi:hypothetical protein
MSPSISQSYFLPEKINIYKVKMELHSIFWFHTVAQPRDKYVHISLPVIHNYPLTIAFLNQPVELSYANISGKIHFSLKPEIVWEKYGFYIYPARAVKMHVRNILFSMGGTGYVTIKPKTRAPVPDLTVHQVYLPGTIFHTYLITKANRPPRLPSILRLGAKRYGVFKLSYKKVGFTFKTGETAMVTHPFNANDTVITEYHGILHHYAGTVSTSGISSTIFKVYDSGEEEVLAVPKFLLEKREDPPWL